MAAPVKRTDTYLAIAFAAMVAADFALQRFRGTDGLTPLLTLFATLAGIVLLFRMLRRSAREAIIWRLRNRLILTYVFIAVVPIGLVLALAGIGTWMVAGQVAVYLIRSELDRRANTLEGPARFLMQAKAGQGGAILAQMAPLIEEGLPGFEAIASGPETVHYPAGSDLTIPPGEWKHRTGYLIRNGRFYFFSHAQSAVRKVLLLAPLEPRLLGSLVPGIGVVSLNPTAKKQLVAGEVPPAQSFLDFEAIWGAPINVIAWDKPGSDDIAVLAIQTRPSAVVSVLWDAQSETAKVELTVFVFVAALLLLVYVVSLIAGVSLTRTITGAVHDLYLGTTKIAKGDFSYRIPVKGRDQLASLATSFNEMTTRIESLVVVAKEKERLQSEVEIAGDVQNQLFPRSAPKMRTIELFGKCQPARMVSGDYYDYLCLPNGNLAVAIGDVAGKGISAALLMASIQSIMRTQLAAGTDDGLHSTSRLVAQLNRQLYESTSPEKYATFFFGIYDEATRTLTYTNAGHLPPLLVRDGEAAVLEVTGTVVGLFPAMKYEEKTIRIESGDLLIAYTDGITEPENDYGEEFGSERLAEIALGHRAAPPCDIVAKMMEAVRQWSTAPELPDDMTLVLARGLN